MKTVVALYVNSTKADYASQALMRQGFDKEQIGIMANRDGDGLSGLVEDYTVEDIATEELPDEGVEAAEGAGIGAVGGAVVGLLAGLGALAVPGIGPVLAAGPLAGALIGAGIGAATGGAIAALTDLGVSDEDAEYYAEGLRRGGAIIALQVAPERVALASEILYRHAPLDMEVTSEQWRAEGWEGWGNEETFFAGADSLATDEQNLDSGAVPDLDPESRAYLTNLDSDSTGTLDALPERPEAAIPDEERHPARTAEPRTQQAATRRGGVRVYGLELD